MFDLPDGRGQRTAVVLSQPLAAAPLRRELADRLQPQGDAAVLPGLITRLPDGDDVTTNQNRPKVVADAEPPGTGPGRYRIGGRPVSGAAGRG